MRLVKAGSSSLSSCLELQLSVSWVKAQLWANTTLLILPRFYHLTFQAGFEHNLCNSNQQNKPCLKHSSWTLAAKEGSLESTYMILNTTCLTWPVFKTVCLNLLANTFPNIVCFCSPDRLLFSNSPFRPSDTAGICWYSENPVRHVYIFFHMRSCVEDCGFIEVFWRGFWMCYKPWPNLIANTFLHVLSWHSSAFS